MKTYLSVFKPAFFIYIGGNTIMKLFHLFAILCLISFNAPCQSKIDIVLQKRIMSMFKEDQKWRNEAQNIYNGKKSKYDEGTINRNMAKADRLNLIEAKSIISAHGFPGYNLVGGLAIIFGQLYSIAMTI
jgi:hypothetical protein